MYVFVLASLFSDEDSLTCRWPSFCFVLTWWRESDYSGVLSYKNNFLFVYQLLSHVLLFAFLWTATHQAPPSFSIFWSLFRFMSIKLVMLSNYLILCCRLLLLSSVFPSIRFFSSELSLHFRWPKYSTVITTIFLLD